MDKTNQNFQLLRMCFSFVLLAKPCPAPILVMYWSTAIYNAILRRYIIDSLAAFSFKNTILRVWDCVIQHIAKGIVKAMIIILYSARYLKDMTFDSTMWRSNVQTRVRIMHSRRYNSQYSGPGRHMLFECLLNINGKPVGTLPFIGRN